MEYFCFLTVEESLIKMVKNLCESPLHVHVFVVVVVFFLFCNVRNTDQDGQVQLVSLILDSTSSFIVDTGSCHIVWTQPKWQKQINSSALAFLFFLLCNFGVYVKQFVQPQQTTILSPHFCVLIRNRCLFLSV